MLSCDRSMPLDTWNLSGTQGNVFGNPRSTFGSSQTPYQKMLHRTNQSAIGAIPVQVSTGRLVAGGEERIGSTTPMPMSAGRPSTMNSYQWKFHRTVFDFFFIFHVSIFFDFLMCCLFVFYLMLFVHFSPSFDLRFISLYSCSLH